MGTVTLRFTYKWPPNIGSWIIARLAGSREFSHCMVIVDGMAYEAVMLDGCRVVPVEQAMKGVAYYEDMLVPVKNTNMAIVWGVAQKGKKYDYLGALGIPFLRSEDWADDSRWWCSEHSLMMIAAGGTRMLDIEQHSRVTPTHLHLCDYPKSGIIRLK